MTAHPRRIRWLVAAAALWLAGCATGPTVKDLSAGHTGWVRYASAYGGLTLRGRLALPALGNGGRVPVVILIHGSGGIDRRGTAWGEFLRAHGIATFEIDYFGPRGVHATSREQPSPTSDVYDAMSLLVTHPRIDGARMAALGFSRGGYMAVMAGDAAHRLAEGGAKLVASVGLYPPCGSLFRVDSSPALPPLLIQVGDEDEIAMSSACVALGEDGKSRGRDVRVSVYPGAAHAWDGSFSGVWFHPAVGRSYTFRADAALTRRSMAEALEFLRGPLGLLH